MLDHIVETLKMLHIERADYVDAGVQQLQNVLVALFITAKRGIGMRQLIDDGHLGASLKNCIKVHLLDRHALVFDPLPRNHLESLDQRRGIESVMGLDESQHNIDPTLF
jgi:hypothetical protein